MNPYGNLKHGGCGSLTYTRWKSMMARCNNVNAHNYKYYGGKGIEVCQEWHDFKTFLSDMGECKDATLTLERIDNSKGYVQGNCRWATKAEQNKNRSYCVELTFNGQTKIATEWAKEIGISANLLYMRLRLGWSVEKALTTPKKQKRT